MEKKIFSRGKKKIKVLLVQHKVATSIDKESNYQESWKNEILGEVLDTTFETSILHLFDNAKASGWRRISCSNLDKAGQLYMLSPFLIKSILKEHLFGFKMDTNKNL